jgi:hypothetical protein
MQRELLAPRNRTLELYAIAAGLAALFLAVINAII